MKKVCGIYKITNLVNNRAYIGQAIDIYQRWNRHKNDYNDSNKQSYNYPLYRAIRKYGLEKFNFSIIEQCCVSDLDKREQYWIAYFGTYGHGYNQTPGGKHPVYNKISPDMLEEITNILLQNNSIKHEDIALLYNVSIEMIQGINTGRYWYRESLNYPLQKRTKKKYYCSVCGKETTKLRYLCRECSCLKMRTVKRPGRDVLVQEIALAGFTKVGEKYGVSANAIVRWCNTYKLPTHKKDIVALYKTTNKT